MYYSPVRHSSSEEDSFDLHVLGTPPAFILSQDQTLRKKLTLLRVKKSRIDWFNKKITVFPITVQLLRCLPFFERAVFYLPIRLMSRVLAD